jgi:DNA (cytosine-5)-methyltransferase 1
MRILDLFCGAGGCSVGYHRAGFEVVGVDLKPQPNYPFEFHQGDALAWLRGHGAAGFHAIHASPPCQAHSVIKHSNGGESKHPDLIPQTRADLRATGLPYVIENVVGAPFIDPIQLCGSSFGLSVRRHRLFEIRGFSMIIPTCNHAAQPKRYRVLRHGAYYLSSVVPVYGTGGGKAHEEWADAMGIDWMTRKELAQAIPPAYTELIGHQLMDALKAGWVSA